jgi:Cd2+/Zn2+-exporting ATPase
MQLVNLWKVKAHTLWQQPFIIMQEISIIPFLGKCRRNCRPWIESNSQWKRALVGNFKLMDKFNIIYDINHANIVYTLIAVAYDKKFAGYITIADSIKTDAKETVDNLHKMGVKATMLSGDKGTVVKYVADQLGIDNAFGDLLPEDKVNKVKEIKAKNQTVAFVGDGVNDAPVVALSDVGMRWEV